MSRFQSWKRDRTPGKEETFKIQVMESSSGSIYEDTETVPGGAIYGYVNVFEIGNEYKLSASVNNEWDSTTILNSGTNRVSITLSGAELRVDVGES